jgi:hypothetical protein
MTDNQRKSIVYLNAVKDDADELIRKLKKGEIDYTLESIKKAYTALSNIFLGIY